MLVKFPSSRAISLLRRLVWCRIARIILHDKIKCRGESTGKGRRRGREGTCWTGLLADVKKKKERKKESKRRVPGLDEKGPNLFSGRPSTPPPAKRLTTVWPSSHNPYYPKRTERPPPPSEERVERPEQKLRGGESTGEACILSPGPPCFPVFFSNYLAAAISSAPFIRVLASFDHSCFRGTNPVSEVSFEQYHALYSAPCTPFYADRESRKIVNRIVHLEISHR